MFANLGFTELMVILVIVLVLFGARRVPEIGASIGKGIREFKKNINEIDRDVRDPIRDSVRDAGLPAGETRPVRVDDEQVRPEPKRLI
ncbi:MAG: Sec-independent protein translocase protein tatA/E-like protein [Gemmatimonadetes bacterium]|jgi:sec-independent protein translocase protein TatA|nr:Sec-independent protein translocase protein tatA/E-like protein [Gemmatimonadota bacterium]